MMGTGESMYFLPSLFYSERSQPCESYLVGAQHSCGKWGVVFITVCYSFQFLKNFVHFSPCQLEFCVLEHNQNQYQYSIWQVIILQCSHVLTDSGFCQEGEEVSFLFAGQFNLIGVSFNSSQQHKQWPYLPFVF